MEHGILRRSLAELDRLADRILQRMNTEIPEKPRSKNDLLPPFERIGEPGWDARIREFLTSYDVPLPEPASAASLDACEQRLGVSLHPSHRLFLETIGPVAMDYVQFFPADEIRRPDEWFVDSLPDEDRARLDSFVRVADAGGSDDVFTLHLPGGGVYLLSHYPASHTQCLETFDDLVRIATINIHTGYYGWPDKEIAEMAQELMEELFGFVL